MAIQTGQLSESLPKFAAQFRSADAKGSSEWEVIQWAGTPPATVTPDRVERPIELIDNEESRPNCFGSRTEALRYSKVHVRRQYPQASQRGHWGVWSWNQEGATKYQSVAPVQKYSTSAAVNQPSDESGRRQGTQGAAPRRLDKTTAVREAKQDLNGAMVRVSSETSRRLREIAAQDTTTLQSVIDIAVKEYYRSWFFRRADSAYDALRKDESAWAEEMAERKSWDATLLDGIDCDERWCEDGTVEDAGTRAGRRG